MRTTSTKKSLRNAITVAGSKGPSLTAGIINRLTAEVADYHHAYARDEAARLFKGRESSATGERASHYATALHGLTIAVSALDPTEAAPWDVAVALHRVTHPSTVTLDTPGRNLLMAIGDPNDEAVTINATERVIAALVAYARGYNDGNLGERHVSRHMLILALSVLNVDQHELARQLVDADTDR